MNNQNNQVCNLIERLGCTEQEALDIIEYDKKVDKMTTKQAEDDLTAEQKKAIKNLKNCAKVVTVVNGYGRKATRTQKIDSNKIELIDFISTALKNDLMNTDNVEIINPQKQINFEYKGKKYSIDLKFRRNDSK